MVCNGSTTISQSLQDLDLVTDLACNVDEVSRPSSCQSSVCRLCKLKPRSEPWLAMYDPCPSVVKSVCFNFTSSAQSAQKLELVTDLTCSVAEGDQPSGCQSNVCRLCKRTNNAQLASYAPCPSATWSVCFESASDEKKKEGFDYMSDARCRTPNSLVGCRPFSNFSPMSPCRLCKLRRDSTLGFYLPCLWVKECLETPSPRQTYIDLDIQTDLACEIDVVSRPRGCESSVCCVCKLRNDAQQDGSKNPCPSVASSVCLDLATADQKAALLDVVSDLACKDDAGSPSPLGCTSKVCRVCKRVGSTSLENYSPCP